MQCNTESQTINENNNQSYTPLCRGRENTLYIYLLRRAEKEREPACISLSWLPLVVRLVGAKLSAPLTRLSNAQGLKSPRLPPCDSVKSLIFIVPCSVCGCNVLDGLTTMDTPDLV